MDKDSNKRSNVSKLQAKVGNQALTSATIAAFFQGKDAEKAAGQVAQIEGTRLTWLFAFFPNTDTVGVKKAVSEYKKQAKGEGDKIPKAIANRASEVQTLYGASRFADFKPDNMGYHEAVSKAVETLRAKKIRWDGGHVAEKYEREARAEVQRESEVELAVRVAQKKAEANGEEFTDAMEKQIRDNTTEAVMTEDMSKLASGLLRKHGSEKCQVLIEKLETAMAAETQEAQAKKQAAG